MQDASAFENPSTSFPTFWRLTSAASKTVVQLGHSGMPCPPFKCLVLLRVELDDELFGEWRSLHVFALRQRHDFGLELFAILFQPGYSALALRDVASFQDHGVLVHLFLDRHFLA